MRKSADGSAGLLHRITKPTSWRGGVHLKGRKWTPGKWIVAEKRKEWARHWQCDTSAQNQENTPWKNKELKKFEEALPRLKECALEKASRFYKAKTGVGCDGFHPEVPLDLTRETRGEVVEFLEKVGQCGKWLQNKLALQYSS